MDVGTELGLIRVRKIGMEPHIDVRPYITAEPAINNLVLLKTWLQQSEAWICNLLADFSDIPLSLLEIGIDWERLGASRP